MAAGAAVCTTGHGQVFYCAETFKAGVTAKLVDSTIQDHIMCALYKGWQKNSGYYLEIYHLT